MQITHLCLSFRAGQLPSQSTIATIEDVRVPVPCTIASQSVQSAGRVTCVADVNLPLSTLILFARDSNFDVGANWHSHTQKRPLAHDQIDTVLLQSLYCVKLAALT